ncbi:MAG TPA: hypothetical protein VFI46_01990 [Jiangellaceae bacterium]|nr:hypothetical protein [Jiangellaceae bacterium]
MIVQTRRVVLAIDPGRDKCGVAVAEAGGVRDRAVVVPQALADLVRAWYGRHGVTDIVIGNRTASSQVAEMLRGIVPLPVRTVEEAGTTLRARARYFDEHPPEGWRRLIPRGLLTPPEPYDDYAAVLLAEAALAEASAAGEPESTPPQ